MKATILQENLSKALSAVGRIVPSRGQLPVLANVLVEAEKEGVILTATNLEMGLRISAGGKVVQTGALTVPARNLAEYMASLPSGNVELSVETDKLEVKAGKAKATFAGIAASEFPVMPKFGERGEKNQLTSIKRKVVSQIAAQVAFAAAGEESRPVLTGIQLVREDKKITVTATDGFRLSRKTIGVEEEKGAERALILPAKTMIELSRMVGEGKKEEVRMEIIGESNQVIFEYDNVQLISRVLEGNFPDVDKIIPTEFTTEVTADREELVRGVKAVSIFARDNSNIIRFRVSEDKLGVEASAAQTGESTDEIEVVKKGEDMVIAFNYRYVLDYLNSEEGERVKIRMNGGLAPAVFVGEEEGKEADRIHLVMPVRI